LLKYREKSDAQGGKMKNKTYLMALTLGLLVMILILV